jgi:hypothetical protein
MRSLLITGVQRTTLAAQTPLPRNIAMSRWFGNPGQVGLFIAASDGCDERPLDSKDSDYDPVWAQEDSACLQQRQALAPAFPLAQCFTDYCCQPPPSAL